MNQQTLIKARGQDVVEIQEFRTTKVPSKENGNKWEEEWCERTHRIGNMRKKGLQSGTSDLLHFQFTGGNGHP